MSFYAPKDLIQKANETAAELSLRLRDFARHAIGKAIEAVEYEKLGIELTEIYLKRHALGAIPL